MARTIFSLVGRIRTEGFEAVQKKLSEADKAFTKLANKVDRVGKNVSKAGMAITKLTAPVIGAAAGVVALATSAGIAADKLLDLEQITGLSTDTLQEMQNVSRDAGVNFEGLVGVIAKLSNQLPEIAKGTGTGSDAIKKLGINVFDSSGRVRDMNALFPEMLAKLRQVDNVTTRNALAQDIFGKSLNDIAPVLGMTTEEFEKSRQAAHDMGLVLGRDGLEAANEFRKGLAGLQAQVVAAGMKIGIAFIPVMRDQLIPLIQTQIVPLFEAAVKRIGEFTKWFSDLNPVLQKSALALVALTVTFGPALIILGKIISSVKLLAVAFSALNLAMMANPWVLAATAILGVATALYTAEKNARSLREELTTGVANKALSDQKKYLEQIIPLYGEMLTASYSAMDSSRVAELKKEIGDLETNLADLGVTLEGGLEKRMESANNALTDLEESTASAGEVVKNFVDLTKTETESLEQAAARAKALAEERKKLSAEWSQRRALQTASELEAIDIEEKAEIDKATAIKASKQTLSDIRAYYTEKRVQIERAAAQAIVDINKEWSDKVRAQIMTRSDLLEWGYQEAIIAAKGSAAAIYDIDLYYDNERAKLRDEEARDKAKKRDDEKQKEAEKQEAIKGLAMQAVEWLIGLGQQETDLRLSQLDEQTEAKRAQVMAATMDDETRALRLAEIDEEADKKKRVLMVKQAKRDKAAAMFAAVINTFQAISKALTLGIPGIILAVVLGALGAAQVAMIAAKPLPQLAEGGMVRKRPGGVQAVIGEGSQDEIVLPMKTGAAELAHQIIQGLAGMVLPPSLPAALAGGGGLTAAAGAPFSGGRGGDTHLHVGTLIADDSGLRNLERMLFKFRAQESNRRGA